MVHVHETSDGRERATVYIVMVTPAEFLPDQKSHTFYKSQAANI